MGDEDDSFGPGSTGRDRPRFRWPVWLARHPKWCRDNIDAQRMWPEESVSATVFFQSQSSSRDYLEGKRSMAYSGYQPNDESRTLLRVIAILLAVIAVCAVVGAGIWLFSWWQARHIFDAAVQDELNLAGTWTQTADSEDEREIELRISSDHPVRGTIAVDYKSSGGKCTATWEESTREYSTIYVDARVTSGDCGDNEWKLSVSGNTMTVSQTWSESNTATPDLILHRNSN